MYLWNLSFEFFTYLAHTLLIFFQYSYYILNESSYVVHDQKSNKKHIQWKVNYKIIQLVNRRNDTTNTNKKGFVHKKVFFTKCITCQPYSCKSARWIELYGVAKCFEWQDSTDFCFACWRKNERTKHSWAS